MMAEKAKIARDPVKRQAILLNTCPQHAKRIGRTLIFPGQTWKEWETKREDVVFAGNMLKFGQNNDASNYLKSTGDKILVEGSEFDAVWGCGINYQDPKIQNKQNWTGQNKLGDVLMMVRDLI
ncbi:unnamed protein product [Ectocarpus sp. 12 AP-2014]